MRVTATWGLRVRSVGGAADFDALVAEIRASGEPAIVFLQGEDGAILSVAVGRDESVLGWFEPARPNELGEAWHSLGDVERKGTLTFVCGNQTSELFAECAIPAALALFAAAEFLATGRRPLGVTWERDE